MNEGLKQEANPTHLFTLAPVGQGRALVSAAKTDRRVKGLNAGSVLCN